MEALKSEIRHGMRIDWDVPAEMDDGVKLRCDVYRPIKEGKYPVILSLGPYSKLLHFGQYFSDQWIRMCEEHPDVPANSSNDFQCFEVCDPEMFVPDGYVCVRFDSRGAGRSPGHMDLWSRREADDLAQCIEWAAKQPWSNGNIGLNGISYLAMNQWQAAEFQPPHLKAICVWEGAADYYRDMTHHGGIACTFGKVLGDGFIYPLQYGMGTKGFKSAMNGEWISGPETLTDLELAANRNDWHNDTVAHPLATDEFWTSRMPDFSKINVPLLSAANWGGQGLHPRGNFEGFLEANTDQKWLEVHGGEHWTEFYTDYGVNLQKKFFDYFLKGEDTGWGKQPRVQLQVRHPGEKFVERHEDEWPLARTQWTKFYLEPSEYLLTDKPATKKGEITYRGFSDGVTFMTPPLQKETEITGPVAAKLWVSSSTEDADIFLVLRVFTPDLREVTFQGSNDPHTPIGLGWLRASHRKLDPEKTLEYRPYHSHDEIQKLSPDDVYELDIEIIPTCIVVPKGYRVALSVRGQDYVWPGGVDAARGIARQGAFTGVGPFRHNDPRDRPPAVFDNEVTLHFDEDKAPYLLLPIIPEK